MENKYFIGGLAVVGLGVYLFTRKPKQELKISDNMASQPQPQPQPKPQPKPQPQPQPQPQPYPLEQERKDFFGTIQTYPKSSYLSKEEATKLALETVTNTMKLFDSIPKESLTELNKFYVAEENRIKQLELDRLEYEKLKKIAKDSAKLYFTFKNENWYVNDDTNIKDWQNIASVSSGVPKPRGQRIMVNSNPYVINSTFIGGMSFIDSPIFNNFKGIKNLQDYVNQFKNQDYANLYNGLKKIYQVVPKEDAIRFSKSVPFVLFTASKQFDYINNYFENNPLSLEEKLFLQDKNYKGKGEFFALGDFFEGLLRSGFSNCEVVNNTLSCKMQELNAFTLTPKDTISLNMLKDTIRINNLAVAYGTRGVLQPSFGFFN